MTVILIEDVMQMLHIKYLWHTSVKIKNHNS